MWLSIRRGHLTLLVQKKDSPSEQLFVFFPEDLSVGVKPIRTFCEKMVEQGVTRGVVIIRNSITPSASKVDSLLYPLLALG